MASYGDTYAICASFVDHVVKARGEYADPPPGEIRDLGAHMNTLRGLASGFLGATHPVAPTGDAEDAAYHELKSHLKHALMRIEDLEDRMPAVEYERLATSSGN